MKNTVAVAEGQTSEQLVHKGLQVSSTDNPSTKQITFSYQYVTQGPHSHILMIGEGGGGQQRFILYT